jgi:hypothetical protein
MKLIAKYFFLEEVLFLVAAIFDLDKYILPWQTCFICGVVLHQNRLVLR